MSTTLSWQTIPGELLGEILAYLEDTTDTLEVASVCENWRRIVYPQLYASISLKSTYNASLLVETLEESKYGPGALMKELNCGELWTSNNKRMFLTLISQCPNLTCLKTEDRKVADTFYSDLLNLFNQGQLQHLQSIPNFSLDKKKALKDLYDCTALAMKDSLTHLQVMAPTAISRHQSTRRQPRRKCLKVGRINLLEHLTSFPRLQSIDVHHAVATFVCDQDPLIDLCCAQTSKVHYKLSNANLLSQSQLLKIPQLEFGKIKQQPHIKELLIYGDVITTRDLEYIMHKFTGLDKLTVGVDHLYEQTLIDWLASNNLLSKEVYARFLQFLMSIGSFEADKLTTAIDVEELLKDMARHRQVKTITLSHCFDDSVEGLHLSLRNKKRELGRLSTEFSYRKDGAWEMMLDALNRNYMAVYKQTLRQFVGNPVEQVYIEQVLEEPFAEDDDIGEALAYILDHYTAVKDIHLIGAKFEFCNAHTVRRLDNLTFSYGTVYPGALTQLFNSLEYVNCMVIDEDALKLIGTDNACISIEMPSTTFGEIALPDLYYDDQEPIIIKIYTSATDTTHYMLSSNDTSGFVTRDTLKYALDGRYTDDLAFVHIKCVNLEKFGTGRLRFHMQNDIL